MVALQTHLTQVGQSYIEPKMLYAFGITSLLLLLIIINDSDQVLVTVQYELAQFINFCYFNRVPGCLCFISKCDCRESFETSLAITALIHYCGICPCKLFLSTRFDLKIAKVWLATPLPSHGLGALPGCSKAAHSACRKNLDSSIHQSPLTLWVIGMPVCVLYL